MRAWPAPPVPALPGTGTRPRVWDTASAALVDPVMGDTAALYVCGITPYDATHLGHANTYLAFDTLTRVWRDAGVTVRAAQNVTDVDDPLLERAAACGVDWRELAASQIALFQGDMAALRILPPAHYEAVTDHVAPIAEAVRALLDAGAAYVIDDGTGDVLFDATAAVDGTAPGSGWCLGAESRLDRATMLTLAADRGGDPDRPGKRDALDPVLWRAARDGEPSWPSVLGDGRPGWHVECTVLARTTVGLPLAVQGGARDLAFPHHEFSAGHAAALGDAPLARAYVHAGFVAHEGEKMSKSLGNLVLVSRLIDGEADPAAIRLALLAHHYRDDWQWDSAELDRASARLERWRAAAAPGAAPSDEALLAGVRAALADDLATPAALELVDAAAVTGLGPLAIDTIDALLGIRIV